MLRKLFLSLSVGFLSIFILNSNAFAVTTIPQSWDWVTNNTAVQWWMNVAWWTDTDKWDSVIQVVKNTINYALWFLWFIALIFLLRGGFKIVTAGEDEWAQEAWKKVLTNAAIGIAFIWISWFLVSFIFYVFSLVTK